MPIAMATCNHPERHRTPNIRPPKRFKLGMSSNSTNDAYKKQNIINRIPRSYSCCFHDHWHQVKISLNQDHPQTHWFQNSPTQVHRSRARLNSSRCAEGTMQQWHVSPLILLTYAKIFFFVFKSCPEGIRWLPFNHS